MKTGQVLRVANYRKGHRGDRWSSRLLSVSIGAVRTHLVPRAEHLHLELHYYHEVFMNFQTFVHTVQGVALGRWRSSTCLFTLKTTVKNVQNI